MDDFLHLLPASADSPAATRAAPASAFASANANDCYAALLSLGYSPIEARAALHEALKESAPEERVEDLIKRALRHVK